MGETLRTGNPDDYRIDDPGGPRFCGRGEVHEGTEGGIESGPRGKSCFLIIPEHQH